MADKKSKKTRCRWCGEPYPWLVPVLAEQALLLLAEAENIQGEARWRREVESVDHLVSRLTVCPDCLEGDE
jgi:hypothetical protein